MPDDRKGSEKEPLKVTDKRIFTAEGEIREEYKASVTAAEPAPQAKPAEPPRETRKPESPKAAEKKQKGAAQVPNTPFTAFIESLIVNAYMSLGMLRSPYQAQQSVDIPAARQMIDILNMLQEKTRGNLTEDEAEFLETHLGELKLQFVQRSKAIPT